MWTDLRLPDRSKLPLEDGKTYRVRMVIGGDSNGDDIYDEFMCVWRQGTCVWIEKETYELYQWIDMDDVWIESK